MRARRDVSTSCGGAHHRAGKPGPKEIRFDDNPNCRPTLASQGIDKISRIRRPTKSPAVEPGSLEIRINLSPFERALETQFNRLLRLRQCKKIRRN
jgi:hypothetical protein